MAVQPEAMLRAASPLIVFVALAGSLQALQTAPTAPDEAEQAIRSVIQQVADARVRRDLEGALALWDPTADTRRMRVHLEWLFKTVDQKLVRLEIPRVTVADGRADARVDADWTFVDQRDGSARDVRDRLLVSLARGPEGWRLTREVSAAAALADALMEGSDEAARIRLLDEEPPLLGTELFGALMRHGQQAQLTKNLPRALTAYAMAEQLAGRIDNREALADALQGLGNVHYHAGRFERALDAFERRLKIEEVLGIKDEIATAVVSIASTKFALGRYLEARDAYERHRSLVAETGRADLLAAADLNIANCNLLLGDHDAAREAYSRAVDLAERARLIYDLPRAVYGLGRAYAGLGDHRRALEAFARALGLQEQAGDASGMAGTLGSMGQVAFDQGQHLRALEYYARSRGMYESLKGLLKDPAGIGRTWVASGLIRAARAEYEEAVRAYEQAIPSFERAVDRDGLAQAQLGLGYALTNLRRFDAAGVAYERARKLYEGANRIGLTRTLLGIGLLRLAQENGAAAADMSRKALELARAVRHRGLETHAHTLAGRAQLQLGEGRLAEEAFTRAIGLIDAMAFDADPDAGISAEDLDEPYHGLIETLVQRGDVRRALATVERGRVRHLQYVLRHMTLAPNMTPDQRARERRAKADLHIVGVQLLRETERPQPDPKRVADLETRAASARAALTAFRESLYRTNALIARARGVVLPVDPAVARQSIPADTVVIVYVVTHRRTYIFALASPSAPATCGARDAGPPGTPYVVTEGAARQDLAVAVMAGTPRIRAGEPHTDWYLRGLGAMLLDPVACHLERASTVVVAPDGALWQVPFEALKTKDGCDAIERWAFVYAPSLTFASLRSNGSTEPAIDEVSAIDGRVTISDAAPLYSHVEETEGAGGRVELQQLAQQSWRPLVTAPHGETQSLATAAGDGLTAWIWALSLGGARAAVVPRWPIDDQALTVFNDEKWGLSPLSVRDAVLRLRNDAVHGKPSNWATFMLIGALQ